MTIENHRKTLRHCLLIAASLALPAAVLAPATAQPAPATRPAEAAGVDGLLEAMHAAGKDLKTLASPVRLIDFDNVTADEVVRLGHLRLKRDGEDVQFRVTFSGRERPEGGVIPDKIEYVLIGDRLIDRNYSAKSQVTRVLSPEQAERDLLKLGEGPFPLPIGQSPEEVRRQFDVREVDPANPDENEYDEPATPGTRRLRLTPKPDSPLAADFLWVELDVDESGFPRKVITLDPGEVNLRITELTDPKLNVDLPPGAFELEEIDASQWNVTVEEM